MFVAILVTSFSFVSGRTQHKRKLERTFQVPFWKDEDLRDELGKTLNEVKGWNVHIATVDIDKLQEIVLARVAGGAYDFDVKDAMSLFPQLKQDAARYRKAVEWMKSLSGTLGIKLRRASRPS